MYLEVIFKTIFCYFLIIFSYRIMGKKEMGKLSVIDLIVSLMIAELAAISIEDENKSLLISVISISTLVLIQIALSFISLKSNKIKDKIDGKPIVIIKNGKINFSEMSKTRYSLDDLITQLREKSIKSIEEVDYAILENDGKLSVFQNTIDYPMPIILDGIINYDTLKNLNKDNKWLFKILKSKNLELEDVFYAFYSKEKTYIITRSDLI